MRLFLALLLALVPFRAAAYLPLELHWDAPAGCPDATDVRARIEANVATRAVTPEPLTAHVRVVAMQGRWAARLTTLSGGASGERSFEAESCSALADAAAFILGLALAPQALPPEPSAPTPPPAPTPVPEAPPPAPEVRTLFVALRPQVGAGVGLLPDPDLFAGAAATLGGLKWRVELSLFGGFAQSHTLSGETGIRTQLRIGGGLRGCYPLLQGSAGDLALCGGLDAAQVHGEGFGLDVNAEADLPWLTGVLAASASLRLSSEFAVRLGLEGGWAFVRPRFTIDGLGDVHVASSVYGRAVLGLEVRVW